MKKKFKIKISMNTSNGFKTSENEVECIYLTKIFGYHFVLIKEGKLFRITELSSGCNVTYPLMKSKCLDFIKKDTKNRGKKVYKYAIDKAIDNNEYLNKEIIENLNKFM